MRIVLTIVLVAHGLIHFMGLAKSYDLGKIAQFSREIPKPLGFLWATTGLLLLFSAFLLYRNKISWSIIAIVGLLLSQMLIFMFWQDAKYGTLANTIILIGVIIAFAMLRFEKKFVSDVRSALDNKSKASTLITEKDLDHLPPVVQKYLEYVGVVGKPKIRNMRIVFQGEMRSKGKDWFSFTSEQYNTFESPTRLFFMKAKVKGLPAHGYHAYKEGSASMDVKVLSMLTTVHEDSPELYPTETVTFFNDLCLFAPAALLDDRITWEAIDDLSVKATFTNGDTSISAILYFNETGQLINFISHDRYAVSEMKTFPFSTPVKAYKNINGYNLPTYGEAIWEYPDGEFVYGRFNLKSIEYNISNIE